MYYTSTAITVLHGVDRTDLTFTFLTVQRDLRLTWQCYGEWRGYCTFSLRVVMLSGRGIESRSFEGTYRLWLLATWRWRQYVHSKRRELVTLLLKSNNTEILNLGYTDKLFAGVSLCKTTRRQQLCAEFIGPLRLRSSQILFTFKSDNLDFIRQSEIGTNG